MTRSLGRLAGVLLAATAARADVAPPKGQVRVPVDHVISADRAYPDYVFVVVVGNEADWSYRGELAQDRPLRIAGAGRGGRARLCWLAAVPAAAARGFQSDKELLRAVIDGKVEGVLKADGASFDAFTVVREKGAPKVVEEKHRIQALDQDKGIVLAGAKVGRADDPDPTGEREESAVRWAVAGVAAAVAVCGLGLWLVGRGWGSAGRPGAGELQ